MQINRLTSFLSTLLLIFSTILFCPSAETQVPFIDSDLLRSDDLVQAKVKNLSPTQTRLGFQEVERKAERINKLSKAERHEYLRANPVPVVVGPYNKLYIVDHHHLARAVYETGHQKLYLKVIENLSTLSKQEFWQVMKARRWVYLRDNVNGTTVTPDNLPTRIEDMKDDPFRSLAGMLRSKNGFIKTEKSFFIEFAWGRALKSAFEAEGRKLRSHWRESDVKQALKFSRSPEAQRLPGSRSSYSCKELIDF